MRIELSPGSNVYRVRLENNQEVQIDASTGKVLSTK
ncbi:PepSY domain-containing protein [Metabacillus hrfriensis]